MGGHLCHSQVQTSHWCYLVDTLVILQPCKVHLFHIAGATGDGRRNSLWGAATAGVNVAPEGASRWASQPPGAPSSAAQEGPDQRSKLTHGCWHSGGGSVRHSDTTCLYWQWLAKRAWHTVVPTCFPLSCSATVLFMQKKNYNLVLLLLLYNILAVKTVRKPKKKKTNTFTKNQRGHVLTRKHTGKINADLSKMHFCIWHSKF